MENDSPPRRGVIPFVWLTVYIDLLGNGLVLPVMPQLIFRTTGAVGGEAAVLGGWLLVIYALMQFVFAPIAGRLSDRYGRRKVLLFCMAGLAVDYALMAFAPNFFWLFVGRTLSGVFGSTFAVALSVVSDVTAPEKRAQRFGLMHAAVGAGLVSGPALGGALAAIEANAPFLAAAAIASFNFVLGAFFFPETHKSAKRSEPRVGPLQRFRSLFAGRALMSALVAYFLMQVAIQSLPSVWSFFVKDAFGWSALITGVSMAFYGFMMVIVQVSVPGTLAPRFGAKRTAGLAVVCAAIAYTGFAFIRSDVWIWPLIVIGTLGVAAFPTLQAAMSKNVGAQRQGELQGTIAAATGLATIAGPFAMTQIYGLSSQSGEGLAWPGAPFAAAAFLSAISLVWIAALPGKAGAPLSNRRAPEPGS